MRVSALERLFVTDRVRRRSTADGFAHAVLHDRAVSVEEGPYVVTNKRGSFVQTRRRLDGTIWAGFYDTALEAEAPLLGKLWETLWQLSLANGWPNRCTSLAEALPLMESLGFKPFGVVVPVTLLREACGEEITVEDAEKLMLAQGHVTKVGEVFVFAAEMPAATALVTAPPTSLGTYTRADEALAIMVFRADRAVVLVGQAEANQAPAHGVA